MGKPSAQRPSNPEAPANGHDRLSRCSHALTFRCVFVLLLTIAAALSGFLWLPPFLGHRSRRGDNQRIAAPIQASFTLHKQISFLAPYTARLGYDIYEEIGVPNTKLSVISMHPLLSTNSTRVTFGVLPEEKYAAIDSVAKSLLRSSLVELMLQQSNLSLTESLFGQPSSFDILKFPGGISVIPVQAAPIWQITRFLFSFTLNNSISDILKNLNELKRQLKIGLSLKSHENVFVQLINFDGSTVAPPVTVQASILSDIGSGSLLPPRLKQLAQVISGSSQNLGLSHTLFGKVKEVVLSSYLNNSIILSEPPSPSPSPTDEFPRPAPPPFPNNMSPPLAPMPADLPCFPCHRTAPSASPPSIAPSSHYWPQSPSSSPPISHFPSSPRQSPCPPSSPPNMPTSHVSPAPSIYFQNPPQKGKTDDYTAPLSLAPAPFSSSAKSNFNIHLWTVTLALLLQILWLLNVI